MTSHHWTTRAIHAGRDDLVDLGLHAPPLDLSTTYPSRDTAAEAARLDVFSAGVDDGGPPIYGRVGNPTVSRFESALAELEGAEAAVAFASGMAALAACLLALVMRGRPHVVAIRPLYGTSDHLLETGLLGTSVTWAEARDAAGAIRGDTGMVIVESPANPTLTEVDIQALSAACAPVPVLVDNTFATPALQRPLDRGAGIVLHSATKYLGGHGDVMGGVIACDELFARSLRQIRFATGGVLHPVAGYQLLRGLSTLPVRMQRASATAAELARRLAAHPAVTRVHYPGLNGAPRPDKQMDGGGAMVSFEVAADPHAVVGAVRLLTPAVSLGSVDSLIQHPVSLTHHVMEPDSREKAGISPRLLRVSTGLEHVDDLWADLAGALARAQALAPSQVPA
ncbi:PLP-dependent aspartate aminotransferase family protein [Streptomyces sp. TS71-3]|uniref:trans-sulfuration enzyme family protein n=1 Tax=Streptomyces sp. TS71-3 TaxID=2733862 RepID=UPI001B00F2BE|nr:PLP-dependent aspartate aminotransferase family protein [Streptomyces sp. TS71-3]GHJ40394.1 cystathionine gamma-synthase [Streptomyces sp. TS71-3]